MKARRGVVFVGCALAAFLGMSAVATAKPGYFVKEKALHLKLALPSGAGASACACRGAGWYC